MIVINQSTIRDKLVSENGVFNIMKKKKPLWKRILHVAGIIVLVVVIAFVSLVAYLSMTEFKPQDKESLEIKGKASRVLNQNDSITLMTWNCGYGALGDNADFFMDGGHSVNTADKARVKENISGLQKEIDSVNPDIVFLQEVDTDSDRSHHINEVEQFTSHETDMQSTFAYNFKVGFIPYPLPPIGKVNSGILTMSSYNLKDSVRYQLPCPFKWPVRLANLKRCVMVDRIPLAGSDKYLVIANLHLEAYDDGEGKVAQTAMLKDILEKEYEKGNYVIAGGDFNQTFSNVDDSAYPPQKGKWASGEIDISTFDKGWQFHMDASTPTCRSLDQPLKGADKKTFQYYVIDGFITSPNIKVSSCKTQDVGFKNTDHNPSVIQFSMKH